VLTQYVIISTLFRSIRIAPTLAVCGDWQQDVDDHHQLVARCQVPVKRCLQIIATTKMQVATTQGRPLHASASALDDNSDHV
jgi:hypothetical protein